MCDAVNLDLCDRLSSPGDFGRQENVDQASSYFSLNSEGFFLSLAPVPSLPLHPLIYLSLSGLSDIIDRSAYLELLTLQLDALGKEVPGSAGDDSRGREPFLAATFRFHELNA